MTDAKVEILKGHLPEDIPNGISGDESIPYEGWKEFVSAVEKGEEEIREAPVMKKRPDYEFNIDKALDVVDLTFSKYTPSTQSIEFFNVIRLVLGEDPEVNNSIAHYFLVDTIFGNVEKENFPYSEEINSKIRINRRKYAFIASRMTAKSTILTAYLPIYIAITGNIPNFGNVMFMVGFGDSQQSGAKVQANTIRDFCSDSDFCKGYFEKMRFTDEECEFIRKGSGKIKDRAFMYKVKGAAGGSVRGIRYRTERPAIIAFDDVIKTDSDASSPIIMEKIRSMMYADAENALGRKGMLIAVNTPFNKSDPIYAALESGIWTPVALPLCERIYIDMPKDQYVASWEQMHDYEKTMERYTDAYYGGTLKEFMKELMLRISSSEDRLIRDKDINYFSRTAMSKALGNYTLLVTTDFTASNKKEVKGDRSGIAVFAIGARNDMFLLDLVLRPMAIQEQYDETFRVVRRWSTGGRVLDVAVEIDGQQQVNLFALEKMMMEQNFWFRFARQKDKPITQKGIRSRSMGNKLLRFKAFVPIIESGRFWIAEELKSTEDYKELMEEFKYATDKALNATHDDGIDLMSQTTMVDYYLPSNDPTVNRDKIESPSKAIWGGIFDTDEDDGNSNSMVF